MSTPVIVLAGSGRIATHLGKRLKGKGLPVAQVLSRTAEHARELGGVLRADWSADWSEIRPDATWVILAVRDDAIAGVAQALAPFVSAALVTHTSGATPGAALAPYFERYGVFYPLQTFSAERTPVWSKIPFCVDAHLEEDVILLKKVAKIIGNLVYRVNDEQRAVLHIAAVFANNFANHCFAIAEKILDQKGLPFELLHPLMEETLAKVLLDSPAIMQTGPAIRGDRETILRHLEWLRQYPAWYELYLGLSQNINPDIDLKAPGKLKKG